MDKIEALTRLHARCIRFAEQLRHNPYRTAEAWTWLLRAEKLDAHVDSLLDEMPYAQQMGLSHLPKLC